MIRVSAVNYLNTLPFIYGMEEKLGEEFIISRDIPSECARKMISGAADIGLVPVAVLPQLKSANIVTPYCIGADGPVDTVLMLSEVPLTEINTVLLDYQSRTSVVLARILATEHWKINPVWTNAERGFEDSIKGNTAGVVIGDRTFGMRSRFNYISDLSLGWKEMTGLPFVFACWVAHNSIDNDSISRFSEALSYGIQNIEAAVEKAGSQLLSKNESLHYLRNRISYTLDESKIKGLNLFREYLGNFPRE